MSRAKNIIIYGISEGNCLEENSKLLYIKKLVRNKDLFVNIVSVKTLDDYRTKDHVVFVIFKSISDVTSLILKYKIKLSVLSRWKKVWSNFNMTLTQRNCLKQLR